MQKNGLVALQKLVWGGGAPVPTITCCPSLVTPSTVKKMNPGPGGYIFRLGGAVMVSERRSLDNRASMNTSRALEWKAWLENPRSINATITNNSSHVDRWNKLTTLPWMFRACKSVGMLTGTVNCFPKPIFSGALRIRGRETNMKGGSSVSTRNSLFVFTGPVRTVRPFGLFPAIRKLP